MLWHLNANKYNALILILLGSFLILSNQSPAHTKDGDVPLVRENSVFHARQTPFTFTRVLSIPII